MVILSFYFLLCSLTSPQTAENAPAELNDIIDPYKLAPARGIPGEYKSNTGNPEYNRPAAGIRFIPRKGNSNYRSFYCQTAATPLGLGPYSLSPGWLSRIRRTISHIPPIIGTRLISIHHPLWEVRYNKLKTESKHLQNIVKIIC